MIYIANERHKAYGVKSFVVDSMDDLPNLPINCNPGSKAFVIDGGKRYILNNSHQWMLFKGTCCPGGGGEEDPEEDEDLIVVYDGGPVEGYKES